jgi:hypothetical protein
VVAFGSPGAIFLTPLGFSDFDPPQAAPDTGDAITPVTPRAFETTNAGGTIHFTARPAGKLIAMSGRAEYVEVQMMNGGYGAVAGPIYNNQGELLSPNVVHQISPASANLELILPSLQDLCALGIEVDADG